MSTARSPIRSRTAASQPSLRTAWCAPHCKANSCFASSLTTATVRSPRARPSWIAAVPTPPAAPCTSSVSPGCALCPPGQREQCGQVVQGGGRRPPRSSCRPATAAPLPPGRTRPPASSRASSSTATRWPRGQPGAGRRRTGPRAGGVHAGRVRKGHLHLIGARGLQQVRERHTGGGYVDEHATIGGWLVHFGPPDAIRACEVHNHMSEHPLLLSRCGQNPVLRTSYCGDYEGDCCPIRRVGPGHPRVPEYLPQRGRMHGPSRRQWPRGSGDPPRGRVPG